MASLTLGASAVGGLVFGVLADKLGRTRALNLSILLYSVFTFACGFAQNVWQFAIFRIFLGLGMGGEWASGATLVSETWPEKHRGKALGIMQSCWAIGYGARRRRRGDRAAAFRLARGVLRRHHPRALHALDSPQRQGAGDVDRLSIRRSAATRKSGFGAPKATTRRSR